MAPRHALRLASWCSPCSPRLPAAAPAQDTPVLTSRAEQDALTRINAYRAGLGLRPVRLDPVLQQEAEWYADDMAANDNFNHDHRDSLGRLPASRLAAFDYKFPDLAAENSAAGYAGRGLDLRAVAAVAAPRAHDARVDVPHHRHRGRLPGGHVVRAGTGCRPSGLIRRDRERRSRTSRRQDDGGGRPRSPSASPCCRASS